MNENKAKIRLALIPLLSAIGSASAIYLAKHYYDLRAGTGGFGSICNINSTLNCDAVTSSKYAELFSGLPLSSFVAGWFVALIILGMMARVTEWKKEVVLTGTIMTGFASLYSIALLFIMSAVLHKFCLFCLIIDAVNFSLFALFVSLTKGRLFDGIRLGKLQTHGLLVAACVFIMVVVLRPAAENERRDATSDEISVMVDGILSSPTFAIATPESAPIVGNPSAPITIHEFSDFQCPHCKRGALAMHQLLSRYEGKFKLVFMPFPLDSACNPLIKGPMHEYACELARTAYCASTEQKFSPVYEQIFEDQDTLTKDSAKNIAVAKGMSETNWKTCVNSEQAKKAVSMAVEEGMKAKVDSTPTFFVNGKKIMGVLPMEAWDMLFAKLSASSK